VPAVKPKRRDDATVVCASNRRKDKERADTASSRARARASVYFDRQRVKRQNPGKYSVKLNSDASFLTNVETGGMQDKRPQK